MSSPEDVESVDSTEPRWVEPSATASLEGDPTDPPGGVSNAGDLCIRLVHLNDLNCSLCEAGVGRGPVGHLEGLPICDSCLMRECRDLGAVLALVSAARVRAGFIREFPHRRTGQLAILGEFVEAFDRAARKWGPARATLILSLLDEPS